MRIQRHVAARILRQKRMAQSQTVAHYIVRALTREGVFSKAHPSPFDYCRTLDGAQARIAVLEKMNPGRRYGIDTVGLRAPNASAPTAPEER
jgi:hypothetical protein